MIDKVPMLSQLIKTLQQVPFLASKNMYRLTSYFLQLDPKKLEHLCAVLLQAREKIAPCQTCFVWMEQKGSCPYCDDPGRDQQLICVVESWHELLIIERAGGYRGTFHILGGVLCPLDGVGPDQLTIDNLLARIERVQARELIFAISQTPEGEATTSYIAKKAAPSGIKISCLARGMPVGSSLALMDRLTIYKAIAERRPY